MNAVSSNIHVKKYIEEFAALASKGKWQEINDKGIAVLAFITNQEDSSQIYARLSAAGFYLQQYDLARMYANKCLVVIQRIQKTQELVENRDLSELATLIRAVSPACDEMEKIAKQ